NSIRHVFGVRLILLYIKQHYTHCPWNRLDGCSAPLWETTCRRPIVMQAPSATVRRLHKAINWLCEGPRSCSAIRTGATPPWNGIPWVYPVPTAASKGFWLSRARLQPVETTPHTTVLPHYWVIIPVLAHKALVLV